MPPGPADAYDTAVVYAARLNRNNATGYEAAIINTPNYTHIGSNPYGSPGGAYGTAANDIVWGKGNTWDFSMVYDWNNGSPIASMTFTSGQTTHTASASLGARISDFINGTGPHLETHELRDVLFRFATVGTYSETPGYTMNSVTVDNLYSKVDNNAIASIGYFNGVDQQLQTELETRWDWASGQTSATNPRNVEFLYLPNIIPDHLGRFEIGGTLTFDWEGNVGSIPQSGVIFEAKLGQYDFFPTSEPFAVVPELGSVSLVLITSLLGMVSRRSRP